MFRSIRIVKLLLILAVTASSLVLAPGPGVSPASSGSHGGEYPTLSGWEGRPIGAGGTDDSDPDEFGIYAADGRESSLTREAVEFGTEDKLPTRELSRVWIAVLRIVWMVRR